jgi:LacI family transcriptional regulator
MAQVTQKEIAKALNVSRETVTKALNGDPMVSTKTAQKVMATAKELGYVPNFFARNLVSQKSRTIGLIIPKISHSFFSTIVEFIYQYVTEKGYNVIPMISFENKNNEIANIETLLSMHVDGIISNISQDTIDDAVYAELSKRGMPVVFFDRIIENPLFSSVTTNDREAACEIVSYALSKGYKKPAHLAGYTRVNIGRERRNGFMDALNRFGIPINPDWIIEGGFSSELRFENAKKLLEQENRPDLIFCFNDSVAESVYQAAKYLNIDIPDELGVIGFGNLKNSRLLRPGLTTVDLPMETIARESVRLLMDRIKRKQKSENVIVKSNLIIRDSCK